MYFLKFYDRFIQKNFDESVISVFQNIKMFIFDTIHINILHIDCDKIYQDAESYSDLIR